MAHVPCWWKKNRITAFFPLVFVFTFRFYPRSTETNTIISSFSGAMVVVVVVVPRFLMNRYWQLDPKPKIRHFHHPI